MDSVVIKVSGANMGRQVFQCWQQSKLSQRTCLSWFGEEAKVETSTKPVKNNNNKRHEMCMEREGSKEASSCTSFFCGDVPAGGHPATKRLRRQQAGVAISWLPDSTVIHVNSVPDPSMNHANTMLSYLSILGGDQGREPGRADWGRTVTTTYTQTRKEHGKMIEMQCKYFGPLWAPITLL